MNPTPTIKCFIKRKLATVVLITASLAAFATLGDERKKDKNASCAYSLSFNAKNFSLRSGYNYRSNDLFSLPAGKQFIVLNTVATYQKGNATFVLPLKKKILLDKIKFAPSR